MNLQKVTDRFPHLSLPENRSYALAYHLESLLPKNGLVEIINPKEILSSLLPAIALQQNCRVKCRGASDEFRRVFAKLNLLAADGVPDVVLMEPDFLTEGGALVLPQAARAGPLVGVCSIDKWTKSNPNTHDFVPLTKIVTELGVFSPSSLKEELKLSGLL